MNLLIEYRAWFSALRREEKILLGVTMLIATVVYFFGQVTFYIDSHTYTMNGYFLLEPLKACHYYWRSAGYPLALYFTGLRWFSSFEGIFLLQMLAAISMPWMLYRMLCTVSTRFAFWAAFAFALTLLPNLMQNTIYQDQLQLALGMIVASLTAQLVMLPPTKKRFCWLVASCGALALFRPTLMVMALLPAALYAYLRYRRKIQEYAQVALGGTAVIFCLLFAHSALYDWVYQSCEEKGVGGVEDAYRIFGKQVFYNAYMHSYGLTNVFSPATGTASTTLAEKVVEYMQTDAMLERVASQEHLYKLRDLLLSGKKDSELGYYILENPRFDYFWLIFFAPIDNATYLQTTAEIYARFPQVPWRILSMGWKTMLLGEIGMMNDEVDMRYLYMVPNFQPTWLILDKNYDLVPSRLADELRGHLHYRYINEEISDVFNGIWRNVYWWVALATTALMSFGALFCLMTIFLPQLQQNHANEIRLYLSTLVIGLLQILPILMLVYPQFRYQAECIMAAIPAASAAAWLIYRIFREDHAI